MDICPSLPGGDGTCVIGHQLGELPPKSKPPPLVEGDGARGRVPEVPQKFPGTRWGCRLLMGYRNPEDMEPAQRGVERGAARGPRGPDDEVVIEHAHPRHVWAAYLPQEALEELAELVVEGWARPQAERYA